MRKAVVRGTDGFVVNVIEIEEDNTWQVPEGCVLIDAGDGSPGDTWDGTKFIKPSPVIDPVEQKRKEAKARAIQAIKDNAGALPWGKILNDMAIAEGWIEPA